MTYSARDLARVRNPALLVSALGWMVLIFDPHGMPMLAHCPTASPAAMQYPASLQMLLSFRPLASMAAGWALMVMAMMLPVLIPPMLQIRLRSLTRRRARSTALFVAAYAAVWMAVGSLLVGSAMATKWFAAESYLPAAGIAVIALVWQVSPIKQRCLNRCHAHAELAAFGAAADFAALRFGITHGIWCAASCWALMLFPMLLPQGHLMAMAAVTLLIFGERLESPGVPRWRWRGPIKLIRMVVAQTRIRLQSRTLSLDREMGY